MNSKPYWNAQDVHAQYPFGSRIYGTCTPNSDYDFIVILSNWNGRHEQYRQIVNDEIHVYNTHGVDSFQKALDINELFALECIDLPDMFPATKGRILPKKKWDYRFDVRQAIQNCENRANEDLKRAKKRLIEGRVDEAKKAFWHYNRVLNFSDQIRRFRRIVDYGAANRIWEEIFTTPDSEFKIGDFE